MFRACRPIGRGGHPPHISCCQRDPVIVLPILAHRCHAPGVGNVGAMRHQYRVVVRRPDHTAAAHRTDILGKVRLDVDRARDTGAQIEHLDTPGLLLDIGKLPGVGRECRVLVSDAGNQRSIQADWIRRTVRSRRVVVAAAGQTNGKCCE